MTTNQLLTQNNTNQRHKLNISALLTHAVRECVERRHRIIMNI